MISKPFFESLLCRVPGLYDFLLKRKGSTKTEKRVFLQMVRAGDLVCDIGANRGYYTALFYHLAGAAGQVHAFEPVPPTFAMLSGNVGFASPARLKLNNAAVGDHEGTATMFLPNGDDGQASLQTHEEGSWKNGSNVTKHDCRLTTLDAYAKTAGFSRLDFVKIDVEGAECLAVRGARETLSKFRPWMCLEMAPEWMKAFGVIPEQLAEELMACGYRDAYLMGDDLQPLSLAARPLLPASFRGPANILCVGGKEEVRRRLLQAGLVAS